jgi:hypothetical protein
VDGMASIDEVTSQIDKLLKELKKPAKSKSSQSFAVAVDSARMSDASTPHISIGFELAALQAGRISIRRTPGASLHRTRVRQ